MKLARKARIILATIAFGAFALTATASYAGEPDQPATTAAGQQERAKAYKDKATDAKKVADEHRAMAAEYGKAHPDMKGGMKNPWNEKMQKHCMAIARDADKLAADYQKAADYHEMRAKELEGK